jgi:hypothetical protein
VIFGPDELLELVGQQAAKHRVPLPVDHATMRTIVAEAERLAGGRAHDEPAALLYACARRARLFGKIAGPVFERVVPAQADAVGLVLDATPLDVILLRGQIAFGAVGWEEVRDTFARWLRPATAPPKPSPWKRPR